MQINLDQNELNFVLNLVMQRPMGEVEGLVFKIRQQIAEQLTPPKPATPAADSDAAVGGTD